jgi:hypothetical protein
VECWTLLLKLRKCPLQQHLCRSGAPSFREELEREPDDRAKTGLRSLWSRLLEASGERNHLGPVSKIVSDAVGCLLGTWVNKGKRRKGRSPQAPRAQRELPWREATGGSTINMQTAGGNGDEEERQTFGGDP